MAIEHSVAIPCGAVHMEGNLALPDETDGIILFAHGSGSSRFSPRNNYVANVLRGAGFGTLLIDLLTVQENQVYQTRFNIPLLTQRLHAALDWLEQDEQTAALPICLFGASTGAAAALQLAALPEAEIQAVVSRGGRPDLAGQDALEHVNAPVLLIVGSLDDVVLDLNRDAFDVMQCEKHLAVVPGATHLFEEPGALEQVAGLAADWFSRHAGRPLYSAPAHQQKGDGHEARSNR
jgi:putative phosphoribosyl transferase